MPIYDFHCPYCGATFESRQSVKTYLLECRACDEGIARRQFTPTRHLYVRDQWCEVTQRELLPLKEDTAAWEARTTGSWRHEPRISHEGLAEALVEDRRAGFDA